MAQLHILENHGHTYRCVVHRTTPAGNNAAGNSWKDVLLGAGLNFTVLPEGNGVGQITTAEKNSVVAGDTVEAVLEIALNSGGTSPAQIGATVTAAYNAWAADFQRKYAQFGRTIG